MKMHKVSSLLIAALTVVACGKEPQGTSTLGALSEPPQGFRQAAPGIKVQLPQDMGAHPEYRLEWWYLTANLRSPDGERFGVQWTLFRNGIQPGPYADDQPGWHRNEIWLAHAALSRPNDHRFADRAARGGTGQAGVTAQPFSAWIDHWKLESVNDNTWALRVDGAGFRYRLEIAPVLPPVLNGDGGFSAKSAEGGGSMYFSYPLKITGGDIEVDGEKFSVSGQGWLDREWSSQYLRSDQEGWDWMALHLEDGRHLMVFRVRGEEDFYSATLVSEEGRSQSLSMGEFSLEPMEYRSTRLGDVPVAWQLGVPAAAIKLQIQSWPGDYWNPGAMRYWEGPVTVSGSHRGQGYLEMTGYER